jgi:hypothetical protein
MAVATLLSFGRKARQVNNLPGLSMLCIIGASQFKAAFPSPLLIGVESSSVSANIYDYLKQNAKLAWIFFDIGSGRAKTTKSGPLGHQKHTHEIECNMAGVTKEASAALGKTLNEGGIAIAILKDGTQQILGSSHIPLNFEHDSDTGAGDNDKNIISFKGVTTSMPWGNVFLGLPFANWGYGLKVSNSGISLSESAVSALGVGAIFLNTATMVFYEKSSLTQSAFFSSGLPGVVLPSGVWLVKTVVRQTNGSEPTYYRL